MAGAKVAVIGSVLEHMVDGGEERCGDGANGFLRTALGLKPKELRLVVAVVLSLGRPGALHEHSLQPWSALAKASAFPLAGAFVLAGTHSGPGYQMARGLEAAHVGADLRK